MIVRLVPGQQYTSEDGLEFVGWSNGGEPDGYDESEWFDDQGRYLGDGLEGASGEFHPLFSVRVPQEQDAIPDDDDFDVAWNSIPEDMRVKIGNGELRLTRGPEGWSAKFMNEGEDDADSFYWVMAKGIAKCRATYEAESEQLVHAVTELLRNS